MHVSTQMLNIVKCIFVLFVDKWNELDACLCFVFHFNG